MVSILVVKLSLWLGAFVANPSQYGQGDGIMTQPAKHPLTLNGRDPANLCGDSIAGDRYWSKEFAQKERDHMWTRIWHVAGRTAELQEAGDYIVHDFMNESVTCVRQDDGSIKAFYNVCQHRGQRLVGSTAHAAQFKCPYHGWAWGRDGVLNFSQDEYDLPQGSPCGKLKLKELRCDTWGGFVWYSMADTSPSLMEYLEPIPEVCKNCPMDTTVGVYWLKVELNTNWKFSTDNFSESSHTRTAHPQVPPWIDQVVDAARHEMYPNGHG
jgi:phenylpropionate dioxygenase-like ring-hydroxylating dioxygenase large terminal subunit